MKNGKLEKMTLCVMLHFSLRETFKTERKKSPKKMPLQSKRLSVVLQNAAFCFSKHGILLSKTRHFATQNAVFWKALNHNHLQRGIFDAKKRLV